MAIPSSRSLIFEVKNTGSELAFGRLRQTSDVVGRLRTSSGIFGNDRAVFKNPSTPRIKISRVYLRKSWQVYSCTCTCTCKGTKKWATKNVQLVLQHTVQRKSVLQVAIQASCSFHVLARDLCQLAQKTF